MHDSCTLAPMINLRYLLLALMLVLTAGCALFPDEIDRTRDWTAEKLYSEAKESLNEGSFETAIEYFEKLEARYPFGRYAQQAQLEIAYAYYKDEEPALAVAACDRFIRLYPRHENVDYAFYLRGLANFTQTTSLVERYLPTDKSERDQGAARDAFQAFSELVRMFPDSKYSVDARQRMIYLRNGLAEHELHIADYYVRRGAYVAASNRAKHVLENFPQTPAVPDALVMLAKVYKLMGMHDLAADTLRVLELNHPGHEGSAEVNAINGS